MTENAVASRVFVSDEKFLEAVYSSDTYAEISEKTGQKLLTTVTRYNKVKKALAEQGIELKKMKRATPVRTKNRVEDLAAIARRLSTQNA